MQQGGGLGDAARQLAAAADSWQQLRPAGQLSAAAASCWQLATATGQLNV